MLEKVNLTFANFLASCLFPCSTITCWRAAGKLKRLARLDWLALNN